MNTSGVKFDFIIPPPLRCVGLCVATYQSIKNERTALSGLNDCMDGEKVVDKKSSIEDSKVYRILRKVIKLKDELKCEGELKLNRLKKLEEILGTRNSKKCVENNARSGRKRNF